MSTIEEPVRVIQTPARTLLGVRVQVVREVVRTWDHDEGAFRALAAEWLELNRTAAATAAAVGT